MKTLSEAEDQGQLASSPSLSRNYPEYTRQKHPQESGYDSGSHLLTAYSGIKIL